MSLVDLGICIYLFAFIVLGVAQGTIRRLIDIGVMMIAFVFAANLRDTVGSFLSDNWSQFNLHYNQLLAFLMLFGVLVIAAGAVTQVFYHRQELTADHPIVDDIGGALLGLVQGLLLLALVVIILNSYALPSPKPGDLGPLRDFQDMLVRQSHIADAIRHSLAPFLVHVFSPLLPAELQTIF